MHYNQQTVRLLNQVAQNAEMGKHTAQDLSGRTPDAAMKRALLRQVQDYTDLQNRARAMLAVGGEEPKPESSMAKWSAQMGLKMQAAMNSDSHHLAKMVIKGSHMGLRDMRRAMAQNPDANPGAMALAQRLYGAEEHWAGQMRTFL